jgi:hypothetical protein
MFAVIGWLLCQAIIGCIALATFVMPIVDRMFTGRGKPGHIICWCICIVAVFGFIAMFKVIPFSVGVNFN